MVFYLQYFFLGKHGWARMSIMCSTPLFYRQIKWLPRILFIHVCPMSTRQVYILSLEFVSNLTSLWPLNRGSGEEVSVALNVFMSKTNVMFFRLSIFVNLPFCALLPLNCWSHEEVTVYIFWCLIKINTLRVLVLTFEVVWDLTFDPLTIGQRWRGHCEHFLIFDQNQHFGSVSFVIWDCLKIDLFFFLPPWPQMTPYQIYIYNSETQYQATPWA